MKASLSVDVDGSHIAQARRLAVSFLSTVRDAHSIPVADSTVEIVQLIVSELVTNARKYAPGPALLQLQVTGSTLRIELWDSNPLPPAVKAPDPRRIGQHGLEIVTALAQDVTIEAIPPGKRITATVMLATA
ncbi:ATP-binding protein [Streptomyces triticiradicis]|uniref:ATP-binding protein n=2 Tax=Streptomyces triticiradicis TaxID=2651189 RepID=A0A7J5D4F8_9ACTN|nr:ATP-binding protein [Streptomyces triticiradicis]